jgi:hypothetical protein
MLPGCDGSGCGITRFAGPAWSVKTVQTTPVNPARTSPWMLCPNPDRGDLPNDHGARTALSASSLCPLAYSRTRLSALRALRLCRLCGRRLSAALMLPPHPRKSVLSVVETPPPRGSFRPHDFVLNDFVNSPTWLPLRCSMLFAPDHVSGPTNIRAAVMGAEKQKGLAGAEWTGSAGRPGRLSSKATLFRKIALSKLVRKV